MKKALLFHLYMICALFGITRTAQANNIRVTDVVMTSQNFNNKTARVRFNLSWQNSWRTNSAPNNWDAAWVFVKYKLQNSYEWKQAVLSTVQANHTAPSGSIIMPSTDGVGAFVYRSSPGTGTFNVNQMELQWNYNDNVLSSNERIEVKVFAIEMVYVPTSSFFVGTGGFENSSFTDGSWTMGSTIPLKIQSEAALGIDDSIGKLWGIDANIGSVPADPERKLLASFPKGFRAFYCMKYEVSQGQYRDFLNSLTRNQQVNRVSHPVLGAYAGGQIYDGVQVLPDNAPRFTPANRIGLRVVADPGANLPLTFACDLNPSISPYTNVNQTNDGEWISMGQLNWTDLAAYLDWAGLRPMTELEFEKAARGDIDPNPYEYIWGDNSIQGSDDITSAGTRTEINPNGANSTFDNHPMVQGPMRVGAFASASTDRGQSGASYYGIMELGGNITERVVSVASNVGITFTGLHGNGTIAPNGNGTQVYWPGSINGEIVNANGIGFRGGSWFNSDFYLMISDRTDANTTTNTRSFEYGGRGVRTAP